MDRRLQSDHHLLQRRPSLATQDSNEEEEQPCFDKAVDKLRHQQVHDIGQEIVQSIASIPNLVPAVLMIADLHTRNYILSTLIMRRVLASKYSVMGGFWLTSMLQSSDRQVSDRAIHYLKIVSDPNLFGSSVKNSSWRGNIQTMCPSRDQVELYYQVSQLQGFIPSLLSLNEKDVEEAATTLIVSKVLDYQISRPFAATVILCDAIFLIILVIAFPGAVNRLLLGASPLTILNFIYVANTGIFYFIIRELGKAVSLCMITKRARIYFFSFWNLTDWLSPVLALVSVVTLRAHYIGEDQTHPVDQNVRTLLAITTGFLWLRVLSFLKGINMQLATFILAILQITRDVLWFCVILILVILATAQMFFTLLAPESCATQSKDIECEQSEYYLRTYAILLGDFGTFEREHFTSVPSVILAVAFSFFVVLILLNVLIALASDSYEKCLLRSLQLFGRARVMMIAELVCFQNLLRRHDHMLAGAADSVYNIWCSRDLLNGWSIASVIFFSLSILFIVFWVVLETTGYLAGYQDQWLWLLINVLLFVGIVIFLSSGAADLVSRLHLVRADDETTSLIQRVVIRLIGTSSPTSNELDGGWQGRIVFLQKEMTRLSEAAILDSQNQAAALEKIIEETELRLRQEIVTLQLGQMESEKKKDR
jgi:hypothetical protein